MSIDLTRAEEKNAFLLEIASFQNGNPAGYIIALPAEKKSPFCGLIDLIRKAEAIFSRENKLSQPPKEDLALRKRDRTVLATFLVTVYFRQHASLQGTVCWVERQKEHSFRSMLELIKIIDSDLRTKVFGGKESVNSGKKGDNCVG